MGDEEKRNAGEGHPAPPDGPSTQAAATGGEPLREEDVTEDDRLDEGDLSESEKLPGDK